MWAREGPGPILFRGKTPGLTVLQTRKPAFSKDHPNLNTWNFTSLLYRRNATLLNHVESTHLPPGRLSSIHPIVHLMSIFYSALYVFAAHLYVATVSLIIAIKHHEHQLLGKGSDGI